MSTSGSIDLGGGFTVADTGGTVTSVALTAPNILSVAGSPVTSAGTIALSLATQAANIVFAGPVSGAAAAPTFRALDADDLPAIDLTAGVTGVLPVANGGTGSATFPILTFTSTAGAGGAATEAMVVTGILATDTILAVSQKTAGATSQPLIGFSGLADDALTAAWPVDPGAGAVIIVTVIR